MAVLTEQCEQVVRRRFAESADVKRRLAEQPYVDTTVRIADAISKSLRGGGKVLVFGNGGSAADAQHIAAELLGRYMLERRSLPAIALADSSAAVTAIGNDYAYEHIFARPINGLGAPGDVALGLSTSGSSPNVLRAMERAAEKGLVTIGMTGDGDCPLREAVDICLSVPSTETPRIQEGYMLAAHTVCELVEAEMSRVE
jgi:D-sedoheptulose 7-phosphate isomerase